LGVAEGTHLISNLGRIEVRTVINASQHNTCLSSHYRFKFVWTAAPFLVLWYELHHT